MATTPSVRAKRRSIPGRLSSSGTDAIDRAWQTASHRSRRTGVRAWADDVRADPGRADGHGAARSDEVGAPVGVDARAGDVAVAPRGEVGHQRGHLVGQAGPAEVGRLVERPVDPGHHVVRVGGVEVLGRRRCRGGSR